MRTDVRCIRLQEMQAAQSISWSRWNRWSADIELMPRKRSKCRNDAHLRSQLLRSVGDLVFHIYWRQTAPSHRVFSFGCAFYQSPSSRIRHRRIGRSSDFDLALCQCSEAIVIMLNYYEQTYITALIKFIRVREWVAWRMNGFLVDPLQLILKLLKFF